MRILTVRVLRIVFRHLPQVILIQDRIQLRPALMTVSGRRQIRPGRQEHQAARKQASLLLQGKRQRKGKIAAGDPVNSSSAFQCLIAGLYDMGNGDPLSDEAWEWAQALVNNLDGVSLNSSSQVYKGVAEGEYVVGLTWEDPAAAYVRDGVAVKVVFPEEGALMSGQCVSIIKGAPHMENAKKFVDYMLSEACQNYVGQNLTVRPLREGTTLNDSLIPWASITPLASYDGVWVAENKGTITERYSECLENAT